MKGKGFTLIELLAVIVILAIIALIATPVVLNIIKDSKFSSIERSAELYINQVITEISRYNMTHPGSNFNPNECELQSDGNLMCNGTLLKVEINGTKPDAGSKIFLSNGSITGLGNFKISDVEFRYIDGKITQFSDVVLCTRVTTSKVGSVPTGKYKVGDEYICKVNETTSYNFYILSTNGSKVNMIMDNNICSDGTLATSSNTCYVSWITEEDYKKVGGTEWKVPGQTDPTGAVLAYHYGSNNKGPVTALDYLNKATSSWTNIPNLNENYTDYEYGKYSFYQGYKSVALTGKARLLSSSEIEYLGSYDRYYTFEMAQTSQKFLLNNLKSYSNVSGTNNIEGIYGYWTMDSSCYAGYNNSAWAVGYVGDFLYGYVSGGKTYDSKYNDFDTSKLGIRPVITLNKSNLQ